MMKYIFGIFIKNKYSVGYRRQGKVSDCGQLGQNDPCSLRYAS